MGISNTVQLPKIKKGYTAMSKVSAISFQSAQKINPQNIKKTAPEKSQQTNNNISNQSSPFSKELIALALLGAATLASCSDDCMDYRPVQDEVTTEQVPESTTPRRKSVCRLVNEMAHSIGLISPDSSIVSYDKVSFSNDKNRYNYQAVAGDGKNLNFNHTIENPDSAKKMFKIDVSALDDNGIQVLKINDNNDTIDNKKYILKNDTINEYEPKDTSFVKSAKIYKVDDKTFEKENINGDKEQYTDISREKPARKSFYFNPFTGEWSVKDNNVEL